MISSGLVTIGTFAVSSRFELLTKNKIYFHQHTYADEVIRGYTLEELHILGANKQTHQSFIRDDRGRERGRAGEEGKSSPLFHSLCHSPVSSF